MNDELVLKLLHGRHRPDEVLHDWGFDGPTLGPLSSVSLTYGAIEICTGNECFDLPLVDGLAHYDGEFYGDMSIMPRQPWRPPEPVEERLLAPPSRLLSKRRERSAVRLPAEQFTEYRDIIAVFLDALRERCGDATADSVRLALSNVVRRR